MAYITNVDSTILPYNDTQMKYDIDLRQYVLTKQGFEDLTGLKFSNYTDNESEIEGFLKEGSSDVYELGVYAHSSLNYIKYKRWLIAKDDSIRQDFKLALAYQIRASLRSGVNLIKDMHGVNIEKGKAMTQDSLQGDVTLAVACQKVLKRLGLLYSGHMAYSQFVDDGTY